MRPSASRTTRWPRSTPRRRRSRPAFEQRWSVWAAGYRRIADAPTAIRSLGSNNTRSSIYGGAVGADYRISPNTLAGFALAGGGTNFSVNGFGSRPIRPVPGRRVHPAQCRPGLSHRRAGLWLAGRHDRSHRDGRRHRPPARAVQCQCVVGPRRRRLSLRVATALAGRRMPPASSRRSNCRPTPSRRSSAPTRLRSPTTPKSVTDTRSELGLRTDKSFAVQNGIFTLRGRAAWAHDFNPDRAIGATFQTLPGASLRRQRRATGRRLPRW